MSKPKKSKSVNAQVTTMYTDGSYKPQTNIGGYAAYIQNNEIVVCGAQKDTTNNRMELLAVINGLQEIPSENQVKVITDSKYVCDSISKKWINNWKRNNWMTSNDTPVKNKDLWEQLETEIAKHPKVEFTWVKGHASTEENNFCDRLATKITQCI